MDNLINIRNQLRSVRIRKDISQKEISEITGTELSNVIHFEKTGSDCVTVKFLMDYAKHVGLSLKITFI